MAFTNEQLEALDDFVYKTCVLAVQHIKNVVELRKAQDVVVLLNEERNEVTSLLPHS